MRNFHREFDEKLYLDERKSPLNGSQNHGSPRILEAPYGKNPADDGAEVFVIRREQEIAAEEGNAT